MFVGSSCAESRCDEMIRQHGEVPAKHFSCLVLSSSSPLTSFSLCSVIIVV